MCLSVHLSVRQSVRDQSDQFSALNSRHITQKLYISYWNSIWKLFSSSGTLLPHTGSYTVCYVICVTHWIHVGWSMSPRTSLESTKSIISFLWCSRMLVHYKFESDKYLIKPLLLASPSADVYTIYSYVHVYGFESHQLWISL